MAALSEVTKSNLHKLPNETYQWNLFCVPLKNLDKEYLQKSKFVHTYKSSKEVLELSISSIESLENDKLIKTRSAMLM